MGFILDKIFNSWINGAIEFFLKIIAEIAGVSVYVLELDIVKQAIIYTQVIALSWVVVVVAFQAIYTYILRMNGDSGADPMALIKGSGQAVAVICTISWIVSYVYKFGTQMAVDVAKLPGAKWDKSTSEIKQTLDLIAKSTSVIPLFVLLSVIVAVVAIIIVLIQTSIRAAELAYAAVAGPLLATGLVTNSGMYSAWWKDVLAISLAQASQLFMLKLSFEALKTMVYKDFPIMSLFLFLGILWVAIKVPKTLQNWVHSTGTGRMATGVAQQAATAVIMRKAMTKGA
ncbi:conjugal transfer protein [Bacillus thuringiensis]|uniref:conjugal transfer protein TrbL family protein n=1 Tax=Bacillus thuringiensis TaxID=1428 RepID=UPI002DBE596F|nr:conjugal transfer protein TrbL family protein [Bacillus thuringiensis]MEC3269018.1 conjugal transfer protein [Bacillus thuringiensis]MED2073489.1 conjugal transfer protein [Bacillus thuringiensis]MED2223044.1 conjugal transfer protein [Bacillus thuringiensis]MED2279991.1 conjugal transfer protein [Bacillus thuringiensis]MED2634737.1 conjugal transfer protein [Bacillus thuringiensis]